MGRDDCVDVDRARTLRRLVLALAAAAGCGPDAPRGEDPDSATPAADLPWAEVLAAAPDPELVPSQPVRQALAATGLPWRVRDRASGVELVLIPPGEYQRGAQPKDALARDDERPRHRVRVAEPLYVGRFEVTQGEWERVLGERPSHFPHDPRRPVESVDRAAVQRFLDRSGLELLTEAEWEYACRAGDDGVRYGEPARIAWYRANAGQSTHPVGELEPNGFGLHDTLGNVAEWTSSFYLPGDYAYVREPMPAGREPPRGMTIVVRGGSWYDSERRIRASSRYSSEPGLAAGHVGLRVKRSLDGR
jgi:formylglycine-generating enzyme required for sulfatase activity